MALAVIVTAFAAAPAVAQKTGMPMGPLSTAKTTVKPTMKPATPTGTKSADMMTSNTMPVDQSNKDMMATMTDMKGASMAMAMMKATGMNSMMSSGTHTIFVPDDSALNGAGMDMAKLNKMMSNKPMVMKIMQGFIMNSNMMPSDMTDGKKLTMMNGQTMTIKMMNGQPTLDGAKITKAIKTSNGMIYMIDSMPSSMMSMASSVMGM